MHATTADHTASRDTDSAAASPSVIARPSFAVVSRVPTKPLGDSRGVIGRPQGGLHYLTIDGSEAARLRAARSQQNAVALMDAVRALCIRESDERLVVEVQWSRCMDALVRDPRRLKASPYLATALAVVERVEAGHRGRIIAAHRDFWDAAMEDARLSGVLLGAGIEPMRRFLSAWALRRRAVLRRYSLALNRVERREDALRRELYNDAVSTQFRWKAQLLAALELHARLDLEIRQIKVAVGLAAVHMAIADASHRQSWWSNSEDKDPLVSTVLHETIQRRVVTAEQFSVRAQLLPRLPLATRVVPLEEAWGRQRALREEDRAAASLFDVLQRAKCLAWLREVEQNEAVSRQLLWMQSVHSRFAEENRLLATVRSTSATRIARWARGIVARRRARQLRLQLDRQLLVSSEGQERDVVASDERGDRDVMQRASFHGQEYASRCCSAMEEFRCRVEILVAAEEAARVLREIAAVDYLMRYSYQYAALATAEKYSRDAIAAENAAEVLSVLPQIESVARYSIEDGAMSTGARIARDGPMWMVYFAAERAMTSDWRRCVGSCSADAEVLLVMSEEPACRLAIAAAEARIRSVSLEGPYAQQALSHIDEPDRRSAIQRQERHDREALRARRSITASAVGSASYRAAMLQQKTTLLQRLETESRSSLAVEERSERMRIFPPFKPF